MYRILIVAITMSFAIVNANAAKTNKTALHANWPKNLSNADAELWKAQVPPVAYLEKDSDSVRKGRKPASSKTFNENDLSPGMKVLRAKIIGGTAEVDGKSQNFIGIKSGDKLADFLLEAKKNFSTYDKATQYFIAPLLIAEPLKGIVWRTRKIFETGGIGNKATHGQAVQLVRNAFAVVQTYFPTEQWEAGVEFLTVPDSKMTQFENIRDLQRFMLTEYVPSLHKAITDITSLYKQEKEKEYVWDNKIGYGIGVFDDGLNRYVGHGVAEKQLALAGLHNTAHDALVFCAYNQDYIISFYGDLGKHFGIDTITVPLIGGDLGVTDAERAKIVKKYVNKGWLDLYISEKINGSVFPAGAQLMSVAYSYLQKSIDYAELAYQTLQGADANNAMLLNPIHYQPISTNNLEIAVKNMKAAISGPTTLRSPVTGETIDVNLPQFYMDPPKNISELMAVHWDLRGEPENTEIRNEKGKVLKYRNYLHGKADGWNNKAWSKIIPSAEGKSADYMRTAKRVLRSTRGAGTLFGMVDLTVR